MQAEKRERGNVFLTKRGDNVANQKRNIDASILLRSTSTGGACRIYLAEETSTYAGPIASHLYLQPAYPQDQQSSAIVSVACSPYWTCNYEFISGTPYFYLSSVDGSGGIYTKSNSSNRLYLQSSAVTGNGSYTESTSSSFTKGVNVSVTESVKIGLPFINGDGTVSSTQTTSRTWAYGKSDSQTRTITNTVDIPVPARTKTRMEAYMVSHTGTVSFVATLRKTTDSSVQFRVTGKWTGVATSEFYCKTWDEATGKELGTYAFPVTEKE